MARVKTFNMGFDPNDVESGSNFVQHPAPTLVRVKISEADLGFVSSTGNKGIHLQFKILGSKPPKKGQQWATLHHYLTNTEAARWRFKELLEALGLPMKSSLKESDLVGKVCLAKLRAEDYEGEHQAKIARLMNLDDEEDVDDDDLDEDEDDADADEDDDNESDEEESDEAEMPDDYNEWSLVQLRAELESRELEATGRKKALVERLETDDDESGPDADDEEAEDEEDAVDYESMSLRELRAAAKEAGIATRGLDKDALIEALEEDAESEADEPDEDEDESDDEEATDYSEWSLKDLRAEAKERKIKTVGLDKDALAEALTEDDGDPFEDDDE